MVLMSFLCVKCTFFIDKSCLRRYTLIADRGSQTIFYYERGNFTMESMKRFTKITAGLLSLTLALGAVGTIPAAPETVNAAAAESSEEQVYEYYLKDVYVLDSIDYYGDYDLRLVPKLGGQYAFFR